MFIGAYREEKIAKKNWHDQSIWNYWIFIYIVLQR